MLTCHADQVHTQGTPLYKPDAYAVKAHRRSTPNIDCPTGTACFNRFPFNGFTCYLTLFSKCFSSFLHSTCSLSVSCQYLALDGIYHPFWAAFPNNPTLRKTIVEACAGQSNTGFSPSLMPCSKELRPSATPEKPSRDYNSPEFNPGDSKFELFPLHSPLLWESLLVSFPPLINMLKFSG